MGSGIIKIPILVLFFGQAITTFYYQKNKPGSLGNIFKVLGRKNHYNKLKIVSNKCS